MCGLTGFLFNNYPSEKWQSALKDMSQTMVHRGPDDCGIWFDARTGVGLAHRRLSIIDLSQEGHQPMTSHSGRYVIVYNGEIYNFEELRKMLSAENFEWRGHSDTEVVLAAIETWGVEKAVGRFIGMFAFGLWDKNERDLYLCRDRLGIKPLYYAYTGKCLLFASELKALRKNPIFTATINRNAVSLFIRYSYIPSPYSIYQNAWKLEPGHILKISIDLVNKQKKLPESYPYWDARSLVVNAQNKQNETINEDETIKKLESLMLDAVNLRMISDVPLGAFLSGGVDSSTIVALMQAQSPIPVRTFTIGFHEDGYNEAEHAKAVARHLRTDHTELYVSPQKALSVIPEMPALYDEPFSDVSQIPTFLLSKLTRQFVTVSLSGDGGDEVFGGYNRHFWLTKIFRKVGWIPSEIRKIILAGLQTIPPPYWDSLFKYFGFLFPSGYRVDTPGDKINKLMAILAQSNQHTMYISLLSHWQKPDTILIDGVQPKTKITNTSEHPPIKEFIHSMMYLDLMTYLPDDILTKVDRASMGVSLEARVPMLDHRVVEFAWTLPLSFKVRDGQGKWILRQILYKYVPKTLIERPKAGFAVPIDSWLRGPLRDWAESLLDPCRIKQEGYFRSNSIQTIWKQHLSGKRNWQYQLWDILMFQAWRERQ